MTPSKFPSLIERGDQYNSFDMPINSLQQLLMALGQIFSFFQYTSHMTLPEHSGDPCDFIFGQKHKKIGDSGDYV